MSTRHITHAYAPLSDTEYELTTYYRRPEDEPRWELFVSNGYPAELGKYTLTIGNVQPPLPAEAAERLRTIDGVLFVSDPKEDSIIGPFSTVLADCRNNRQAIGQNELAELIQASIIDQ
jgi:hypothetical protein